MQQIVAEGRGLTAAGLQSLPLLRQRPASGRWLIIETPREREDIQWHGSLEYSSPSP
jgi:hypothetical protein